MKTRKLISALISVAMVISMLPMTLASAADISVPEMVSANKPAYVYVDGNLDASSANMTDGDSSSYVNWVNNGGDKPTYIDLETSYEITQVFVERTSGWGPESGKFELYASNTLYTTSTDVKANASLIGINEEVGTSVTIKAAAPVTGQYVYLVPTTGQTLFEIKVYANKTVTGVTEQKVSVGKPASAYSDGNLKSGSYLLTDGDASRADATCASWINNAGDKPVTIDLEATYYISKIILYRRHYGEPNGACSFYASDSVYTTITDVKAKATLIGSTAEVATNEVEFIPNGVVPGRYVYLTPDTAQGIDEIEVYAMAPRTATPISASETTTFMAKDYAADFAAAFGADTWAKDVNPWAGLTGISQLSAQFGNWMYAPSSCGAGTMSFPVKFAADGVYKLELRAGVQSMKARDFHQYDVYLTDANGDRVDFGGAALYNEYNYGGEGADTVGSTGSHASGSIDYKALTGKAYVEAGEYTLNIGMDTKNVGLFLHNIAVVPCGDPAQVSSEGTYLEAEDYIYGVAAAAHASAHGGTAIFDSWLESTGTTATYKMPISVSEAGTYDIETVMTQVVGINTSPITVKVNGEVVYTNDENGENISGCDGDGETTETDAFYSDYFRMHKYTAAVELTEGLNNIEFVIDRAEVEFENSAIDIHKFGIDYVKLAKSTKSFVVDEDGFATIDITYDTELDGRVFAVFYNEGMIAAFAEGEFDANVATIYADVYELDYDEVKVFVWNDLMVPQADVVNF